MSILCAEDNPYGRVVMNTILRELGHRVDFAETGEAAASFSRAAKIFGLRAGSALNRRSTIQLTRKVPVRMAVSKLKPCSATAIMVRKAWASA